MRLPGWMTARIDDGEFNKYDLLAAVIVGGVILFVLW